MVGSGVNKKARPVKGVLFFCLLVDLTPVNGKQIGISTFMKSFLKNKK
jgi:hypothetical protein